MNPQIDAFEEIHTTLSIIRNGEKCAFQRTL